jgi:hypothetical protein
MVHTPLSIAAGRPAHGAPLESALSCLIAVPCVSRREVLLAQPQAITAVIARRRATDGA